jgi:hypothetical protein
MLTAMTEPPRIRRTNTRSTRAAMPTAAQIPRIAATGNGSSPARAVVYAPTSSRAGYAKLMTPVALKTRTKPSASRA